MSVNFNINNTNTRATNNENTDPQISGEANSVFKDVPKEILSEIFEYVPYHQMNNANIGPKGVSKRWNVVSANSAKRRSLISPKSSDPALRILNGQKRPSGRKNSQGPISKRRLAF